MSTLSLLTSLFLLVIGLIIAAIVVVFFIDVTQTTDAVRKNYPVIGRFRKVFTTLGEFFRQYFFAMDREEMPFNRAEREWVEVDTKLVARWIGNFCKLPIPDTG